MLEDIYAHSAIKIRKEKETKNRSILLLLQIISTTTLPIIFETLKYFLSQQKSSLLRSIVNKIKNLRFNKKSIKLQNEHWNWRFRIQFLLFRSVLVLSLFIGTLLSAFFILNFHGHKTSSSCHRRWTLNNEKQFINLTEKLRTRYFRYFMCPMAVHLWNSILVSRSSLHFSSWNCHHHHRHRNKLFLELLISSFQF